MLKAAGDVYDTYNMKIIRLQSHRNSQILDWIASKQLVQHDRYSNVYDVHLNRWYTLQIE